MDVVPAAFATHVVAPRPARGTTSARGRRRSKTLSAAEVEAEVPTDGHCHAADGGGRSRREASHGAADMRKAEDSWTKELEHRQDDKDGLKKSQSLFGFMLRKPATRDTTEENTYPRTIYARSTTSLQTDDEHKMYSVGGGRSTMGRPRPSSIKETKPKKVKEAKPKKVKEPKPPKPPKAPKPKKAPAAGTDYMSLGMGIGGDVLHKYEDLSLRGMGMGAPAPPRSVSSSKRALKSMSSTTSITTSSLTTDGSPRERSMSLMTVTSSIAMSVSEQNPEQQSSAALQPTDDARPQALLATELPTPGPAPVLSPLDVVEGTRATGSGPATSEFSSPPPNTTTSDAAHGAVTASPTDAIKVPGYRRDSSIVQTFSEEEEQRPFVPDNLFGLQGHDDSLEPIPDETRDKAPHVPLDVDGTKPPEGGEPAVELEASAKPERKSRGRFLRRLTDMDDERKEKKKKTKSPSQSRPAASGAGVGMFSFPEGGPLPIFLMGTPSFPQGVRRKDKGSAPSSRVPSQSPASSGAPPMTPPVDRPHRHRFTSDPMTLDAASEASLDSPDVATALPQDALKALEDTSELHIAEVSSQDHQARRSRRESVVDVGAGRLSILNSKRSKESLRHAHVIDEVLTFLSLGDGVASVADDSKQAQGSRSRAASDVSQDSTSSRSHAPSAFSLRRRGLDMSPLHIEVPQPDVAVVGRPYAPSHSLSSAHHAHASPTDYIVPDGYTSASSPRSPHGPSPAYSYTHGPRRQVSSTYSHRSALPSPATAPHTPTTPLSPQSQSPQSADLHHLVARPARTSSIASPAAQGTSITHLEPGSYFPPYNTPARTQNRAHPYAAGAGRHSIHKTAVEQPAHAVSPSVLYPSMDIPLPPPSLPLPPRPGSIQAMPRSPRFLPAASPAPAPAGVAVASPAPPASTLHLAVSDSSPTIPVSPGLPTIDFSRRPDDASESFSFASEDSETPTVAEVPPDRRGRTHEVHLHALEDPIQCPPSNRASRQGLGDDGHGALSRSISRDPLGMHTSHTARSMTPMSWRYSRPLSDCSPTLPSDIPLCDSSPTLPNSPGSMRHTLPYLNDAASSSYSSISHVMDEPHDLNSLGMSGMSAGVGEGLSVTLNGNSPASTSGSTCEDVVTPQTERDITFDFSDAVEPAFQEQSALTGTYSATLLYPAPRNRPVMASSRPMSPMAYANRCGPVVRSSRRSSGMSFAPNV